MRNKKQIVIMLGALALSTQALYAQRAMTVKDVQDFQRISKDSNTRMKYQK